MKKVALDVDKRYTYNLYTFYFSKIKTFIDERMFLYYNFICVEVEMKNKICQSCGMPIISEDQLGTNSDGSINEDYCKYCYKNGEFIDKVTMEEYIEMCSKYGSQAGMTNEVMKEYCKKLFPTLKRWK